MTTLNPSDLTPTNWPNSQSRLSELLNLLNLSDYLRDPQGARTDVRHIRRDFVADAGRLSIHFGHDEILQMLNDVFSDHAPSHLAVNAYLERVAIHVRFIEQACAELSLMARNGHMSGYDLENLIELHARIRKTSFFEVLAWTIAEFLEVLTDWPTPNSHLCDIRTLYEILTPHKHDGEFLILVNTRAATFYLQRVRRLITDIRIACVEMGIINSWDDLGIDAIDALVRHLSTTTRQTPDEILSWSLTSTVRMLAESHLDASKVSGMLGSGDAESTSNAELASPPESGGGQTGAATGGKKTCPSENAVKCYRVHFAKKMTQEEIATLLTLELGCPVSQGQVSRWIKLVTKWIEDGNVLPAMPTPPRRQPRSIESSKLDLGQRQDHRTSRQRPRRSEDSDD